MQMEPVVLTLKLILRRPYFSICFASCQSESLESKKNYDSLFSFLFFFKFYYIYIFLKSIEAVFIIGQTENKCLSRVE